MEENVALDSTKKKKFLKSIRGIQKRIKKNERKEEAAKLVVVEKTEEKKKPKKRVKPDKGLVYLSHIPHGFYEHQMTEYFKQFGGVTNARVIRSKRTGRSKGYAFIEFNEPSVAQIVAETMNNYLMGKRLLKAAYIPPEKQRKKAMRKNWNAVHNPSMVQRLKHKKAFNAVKDENDELKRARKQLFNLERTKKKLAELGINYDFFTPVDVPLALINVKEEKDKDEPTVKVETEVKPQKTKNEKKEEKAKTGDKKIAKEKDAVKKIESIKIEKKDKLKVDSKIIDKNAKKDKKRIVKVDKKEQEQKQEELDKAGVKGVENFIKVKESNNDSDSSVEFDSDEYEKMLLDDDSDDNDEDGTDDGDEGDGSDETDIEEESVVDYPPEKPKGRAPKVLPPKNNDKQEKQQELANKSGQVKRKRAQQVPVVSKKPKFEKQNKPIPAKQFKKKK